MPSGSVRSDAPAADATVMTRSTSPAFKSLDCIIGVPRVKDQVEARRPLRQRRRQPGAERGTGNVGRDEPDRTATVGQPRWPGRNDDSQLGRAPRQPGPHGADAAVLFGAGHRRIDGRCARELPAGRCDRNDDQWAVCATQGHRADTAGRGRHRSRSTTCANSMTPHWRGRARMTDPESFRYRG